ncbi:tetratricopeptide repeat protein, partial [Micromonospora thermarum]
MATLGVFLLSVPLAFAVNAGSAEGRWPGWLDLVRRHPFWSVAILGLASVTVIAVTVIRENGGPAPASTVDLCAAEGRLQRRFDEAELDKAGTDDRLEALPPYPRALIRDSGDRAAIWKVVAPFADAAVDPRRLASEWAAAPPPAIDELPAVGQLAVAELLVAHGQPAAAVEHLRAALRLGATPRAYWLVRAAQMVWTTEGQSSRRATDLLTEAQGVDPGYPLLKAVRLIDSGEWKGAEDALTGWFPSAPGERDTALSVLGVTLEQQQRLDEAISAIEGGAIATSNAGLLLQLSRMLLSRSVQGGGDSRWKDAYRSIEVALRARNLRRSWRGDSAEAVVAAAEAAIIADDHQQVWSITRPPPDGDATTNEAADDRVLPLAAMGAALTGRIAKARDLVANAPDGYVRKRVEAEIASSPLRDGAPGTTATAAWMDVYRASTTDEQKLQALRGLAMEGATDQIALDDLRPRYPQVIAEIEMAVEVMSISGPSADERLRELESRTPLASVRRADLLRPRDPELAASVLADATARWNDPRLLLLAVDCYIDAGRWADADSLAQQAIADSGMLWPGRTTLLRRIVFVQSFLANWPKVATACRALLEVDPNDDDARWNLAFARFRSGELHDAWRTLNRSSVAAEVSTPHRAIFLLDLVRRYGDATRVARTALEMLRAFPDDQGVHAAAINAVTMRADRADLPDDIGLQVTAAWSSFIERYPDSEVMTRYTIHEGDNPLAEIESQLREHEAAYRQVLSMVQDQMLPIGLFDRVVGKPYSAIFPYRPLGYHRAAFSASHDITVELEMACSASTNICIIDASALYTLALIPEFAQALISLTHRPTIIDAALRDLAEADDHFNMPTSGTIAYDADLGRIVTAENDPDIVRRQQEQIRAMLATARQLRRLIHPTLVHLRPMGEEREPVWLLTVDAAKDTDSVIWADDLGLRRLAHSLGLKTFGTWSLLSVARERQRIDDSQLDKATRMLIREYVVDLPFNQAALLSVAAEQNWEPRSVATVLSRPASWVNVEPAIELFREAFRKAPGEMRAGWAYATLQGLAKASLPEHRHNNLVGLAAATLGDDWTRPEQSSALIAGLEAADPEEACGITRAALDRVWKQVKERYPLPDAATVFLHII